MASNPGNTVNRAELAKTFGITVTAVDAWLRAGCPYVQRAAGKGRPWQFDTASVAQWRVQRAVEEAGGADVQDEAAWRRRKVAADAKRSEMELAKEMGLIAPVEQMERALSNAFLLVKSSLRGNLVARLALQLVGETDARKFKRVALAEIDDVLRSLAALDFTVEEVESEGEAA